MTTLLLDPLDEARIRVAHREILDTVRALGAEVETDADADRGAWLAAARATAAFLREHVAAVARWEEACYPPASLTAEETGFEHAFVAAEVDGFAVAVGALAAAGGSAGGWAAGVAQVRRRLARVEAVVELHVLKAEDRSATMAAYPPAPTGAGTGLGPPAIDAGRGAARELPRPHAEALLERNAWGMLGTIGEAGPYVIPVAYGYDRDGLVLASGPGRKLANLRRDPRVCLTVEEIVDGDDWLCVLAEGEALPLTAAAERAAAVATLARQHAAGGRAAAFAVRRLPAATLLRVREPRISGRSRGAGFRPTEARPGSARGASRV